jgi:hypothetical protein
MYTPQERSTDVVRKERSYSYIITQECRGEEEPYILPVNTDSSCNYCETSVSPVNVGQEVLCRELLSCRLGGIYCLTFRARK